MSRCVNVCCEIVASCIDYCTCPVVFPTEICNFVRGLVGAPHLQ